MKIEVFFSRDDLPSEVPKNFRDSTAVVIDVLRASTTIIQAISFGARKIFVVKTPEDAFSLRENLEESVLLCGERDGLIIPGFDLGNSPLDYTEENIGNETLIYCSTNGSATLLACQFARKVLIGGFVNLNALIEKIRDDERVFLVCSGKLGRFSLEDALCAGMIIEQLSAGGFKPELLSDSAITSYWLFERYLSNPDETLANAEHAVYLSRDLGLAEDVAFCTRVGIFDLVPVFSRGIIEGQV